MIFFWLVLILGIVLIPFGIEGTFIIFADALVYGLLTGFERVTLLFLGLLLGIALLVELFEFVFGGILARKFGGSKWAVAGAIIGGFLGAVIGTSVMPVLGTFVCGFSGSFLGAFSVELFQSWNFKNALKVGAGAFMGALVGKVTKVIVAVAMVVMIGIKVF
jgi:uncharacterized protein YqgC (DUF456 family)